jgi:hypothetical protein
MKVKETTSGQEKNVVVSVAQEKDFKRLTKQRYSFNWKLLSKAATVYVLCIERKDDILGAIGLVDFPAEKRIEIKLLASAKENIGVDKLVDGIAGCLIAFACRLAVTKYGAEACVSLVPKTELREHYMRKYYMLNAGWQLYLEGKELQKLLKEYFV